ncbi:APC family permease [Rhodotorula paludigena]|uniref:APC family permease n=1 Tax=Rhodotorula paludigena TaxID=86838 RepID=UPI00317CC79D
MPKGRSSVHEHEAQPGSSSRALDEAVRINELDRDERTSSSATGVEPGGSGAVRRRRNSNAPSYAASEFIEIVRRQRVRSHSNNLKLPRHLLPRSSPSSPSHSPQRTPSFDSPPPATAAHVYPPPRIEAADDPVAGSDEPTSASSGKAPPRVEHEWDFAGWGQMSYLELSDDELDEARRSRAEEIRRDGEGSLGSWLASGVAGVAVAGSPLYAFPALVGIASVYSPISLFVATLLLSFWRPIMTELASALPISGANYAYLLNTSASVPFALLGASLTLLDDIATSVVAAATASSYIADQAGGVVITTWMTVVLLATIAVIGLVGVRGTASVTLATLSLHLLTLAVLVLSALVHWGQQGNIVLRANWHAGQIDGAGGIAKAVYQGVCIAFLGVTGFETAPDYATSLRPAPHVYPTVLRSLQLIAIFINAPLLLCTFAVLPLDEILGVPSVLSAVGRTSAGRWLEVWVTVDAVLILSATVLAGLISAIALLHRMSLDGTLPRLLLKPLPHTGVPALVVILFTALCLVIYATSGAHLGVISSMFAIVFLSIMALYPVSLLILSYNRPTLPRRARRTPFLLVLLTLVLSLALIAGVVSTDPASIGYAVAYTAAIAGALLAAARWGRWMRAAWWIAEHGLGWARGADWCVEMMRRAKEGKEVVVFVKSDEINTLFRRILYVQQNETTSRIKLVHFYGAARPVVAASRSGSPAAEAGDKEEVELDGPAVDLPQLNHSGDEADKEGAGPYAGGLEELPSELEANFRLLDEAFPSITIDLIFLRAPFSPTHVHALAQRLKLPVARMFMGCPSERWAREREFGLRELAGVRVIPG